MEQSSSNRGFRLDAIMSPEIVEISEDSMSLSRNGKDVYVAVGKDDSDTVKWALNNALLPGSCVFLIHVFTPVNYIPTPVGRLSKSQVSPDQWKCFINQETQRRRNHLQKYIRLCDDSKVVAETILIESNMIEKVIVDLIPVLNITRLIVGTKRPSRS
ncbi:U-box domain-containing protein 33-like isoform X2 [Tasmannia lanceolata]|uniref:U-box domain-containing protein 33-like isoform X2 n=1 Tax=Tasmannia lanceolata TaxID=3420 RepID=UPI0040639C3B